MPRPGFQFRANGVDGGQAVIQQVDRRQAGQFVSQGNFQEPGVCSAVYQERCELLPGGRVHIAIAVALFNVVGVQPVITLAESGGHQAARQVFILAQDTALVTVGLELIYLQAYRHAGIAMFTMGAVIVGATAPEPQ